MAVFGVANADPGLEEAGSRVAKLVKIVFLKAEVVPDLVQDGDAYLLPDRFVACRPAAGLGEDSLAKEVDRLRLIMPMFDRTLGHGGAGVKAAELLKGRIHAELFEELWVRMILDDERGKLEKVMQVRRKFIEHMLEQGVETIALGGVHAVGAPNNR